MPKIEVNEKLFFNLVGKTYDYDTLEKKLTSGKAELDEKPNTADPADKRVITVDPELKDIRPYMVAFVISGKPIDEPMLLDIIQTQEKLCWNFGRKRKSISMGVYRNADIVWPAHYKAADPDKEGFVPLQETQKQSLRAIVQNHPKGKEYGWILEGLKKFPLFTDDKGEVLSMAPIINSATLGQVQVGDKDLLVELTGDDMSNLLLSANIVACDFADAGYQILPVTVQHPYDTGFGKEVTAPYYFQTTTDARLTAINKKLGSELTVAQVTQALERMGNTVSSTQKDGDTVFTVKPAPYRNDFLHEVDVIEDVMIGVGLDFFTPQSPSDFTIGRLLPITEYSRKVKNLMAGMGYQEMIFNYLGSKASYITKMGVDGNNVIEIANPMSENYQFIRPSIIASLFEAESQSGNAVYPHKIFEVGKIAYIDPSENTGTKTIQSLGFVTASNNANFNDTASEVSTLLYYLDHKYEVTETNDPRFIPGRQAGIMVNGKQVGIFGEIHPQVLENWQVGVPCVAGEMDLEALLATTPSAHAAPATQNSTEQKAAAEPFNQIAHFDKYIDLRVAVIKSVETNPQGEKLYIEHLDDGTGTERIIQSGLREYLTPEELIGQHVIIAANLAPRKMRGVESHGMLLAADYTEDGKEKVELLTAPWAAPGTPVIPQGSNEASANEKPAKIDIDRFCKVQYRIAGKQAQVGGVTLTAAGKAITTQKADNCDIE